MEYNDQKYPEPPELRKQGVMPLEKLMKKVAIGILVAFIIVVTFAIIFRLKDG